MKYKYTIEQLKEAVATSFYILEVLNKLGIVPAGGNYQTIKRLLIKQSIDISHFRGKVWNKGKQTSSKQPIEDYLNGSRFITSHKLRIRLLKEKILENKCSICDLTEWLGKQIPLELDHIDGNHNNNTLSNLRIICPNCHAQTSTYRGKNKKKK